MILKIFSYTIVILNYHCTFYNVIVCKLLRTLFKTLFRIIVILIFLEQAFKDGEVLLFIVLCLVQDADHLKVQLAAFLAAKAGELEGLVLQLLLWGVAERMHIQFHNSCKGKKSSGINFLTKSSLTNWQGAMAEWLMHMTHNQEVLGLIPVYLYLLAFQFEVQYAWS